MEQKQCLTAMNGFTIVSSLNTLWIEGPNFDRIFQHQITESSPNKKPHRIVGMMRDSLASKGTDNTARCHEVSIPLHLQTNSGAHKPHIPLYCFP
jgi:hypothetical protein